MPDLASLAAQIVDGSVEVVDLTAPLHASTPILRLPAQFGQTAPFSLEEISRYDERGPAWYWNNIHTGEHTGTHLDAPNHWVSGKDLPDVAQIPPQRLVGPAVVIDRAVDVAANPDYLLDVADLEEWQSVHGTLPARGWLLYRTGWSRHGDDPASFANADDAGPHTPGPPPGTWRLLACSAWEWRPSAPTPARRAGSIRPTPATTCCSAPTCTGSPSCVTSTACRSPDRS
jgi:kynurenine formamidase